MKRRNNVALATMHDLMTAELRDLYSAEMQMLVALPAMAAGAGSPALRDAFRSHLDDTHEHVSRLEEIFGGCHSTFFVRIRCPDPAPSPKQSY